ncbi:MAG: PhnD/SsuA/transferrin family substrate-binding protein [Aestuariivirga sp.]
MIAAEGLVSLPMYDWPEVRSATDAFWAGVARHAGLFGRLSREKAYDALWRDPALIFSQTCGYPFTHEFKGLLQYIGTPHYQADGCEGAFYRSIVFARVNEPLASFKGARPAINSRDSMSGYLALKAVFAPLAVKGEFFAPTLVSGGHLNSMAAVREGRADLCSIDAVCVGLARKHRPQDLQGLVEIARSPLVPGLPFVTRAGDVSTLRRAVHAALVDPELAEARAEVLLEGFSVLPNGAYGQIIALENSLPPLEL